MHINVILFLELMTRVERESYTLWWKGLAACVLECNTTKMWGWSFALFILHKYLQMFLYRFFFALYNELTCWGNDCVCNPTCIANAVKYANNMHDSNLHFILYSLSTRLVEHESHTPNNIISVHLDVITVHFFRYGTWIC